MPVSSILLKPFYDCVKVVLSPVSLMSLYMKLPFSLQASKTEEMAPSTPISETRSSRDPSTPNLDIENSRCISIFRYNGQDVRRSKIYSPQNQYWRSTEKPFQGIAPAIAIQGTGVPEILPPQKLIFKAPDAQRHLLPQSRVFEAPGSFLPRLDIEASVSKRFNNSLHPRRPRSR